MTQIKKLHTPTIISGEVYRLHYEVIASGSKGNAVLINDILIDCGVPYNRLRDYLYDVKYLIITHKHSDHLRLPTFNKIVNQFPHITVISNWQVAEIIKVDYIINAGFTLEVEDYELNAFECVHDVVTYGYYWYYDDVKIIYATDTSSMENAPTDIKFDYIFIESNYDESKLEMIRNNNRKYGYNAYASALRHLSKQQAKEFYYLNRSNRDSELIELHKSSRFY